MAKKTKTAEPKQMTLQSFLKLHALDPDQKTVRRALRSKFRKTDDHEHNTRWQFNVGSPVHVFLSEKFNVSVKKTS